MDEREGFLEEDETDLWREDYAGSETEGEWVLWGKAPLPIRGTSSGDRERSFGEEGLGRGKRSHNEKGGVLEEREKNSWRGKRNF